ncbi:MAG TPA: methylenetetrahydrofolate reductase C-terminal domain-containing protein [Candidatus Wallbacteria bacterium]|nr:MAG: hypothetical protein BWY32_01024 [bacterium ADurb.Bin243]HOD40364.1 methylenetetrahydrofolate reductase C-terminal domain-containing protein [Candidatus Wallbacteria bacterium]HPG57499.1 methylenetetrahydrofolate reductase C-terminal domain-containing protein [Candidatus Wallbacteria bacterium]
MIKTVFDEKLNLLNEIPAGASIGIIACADCAAAFKTADTRRIEQVKKIFGGRNETLFTLSVNSPCDRRVLAQFAAAVRGFDKADCYIILACEAGRRSAAEYIAQRRKSGEDFKIISPVKTVSYVSLDCSGVSHEACVFCGECVRSSSAAAACPVAACPINKKDGPCQSRANDFCVIEGFESRRCSWLY